MYLARYIRYTRDDRLQRWLMTVGYLVVSKIQPGEYIHINVQAVFPSKFQDVKISLEKKKFNSRKHRCCHLHILTRKNEWINNGRK